jgi:Flp pilus assembly protein TadD/SAM-dependent methyltransferase
VQSARDLSSITDLHSEDRSRFIAVMNPLFASAVQRMQAGELAEAERLCRTILSTEPNDAASIHLLGFIAYKAGRFDTAIELIEQAIALDGNNPDCHFNIGLALLAAGRLRDAVTHFNRATELKPDYSAAVSNLVNLAYTTANRALEQGKLADAIAGYRQVAAIKPDFAEAHSNLGVALMAQGNPVDAAAAYRRAIEINPNLVVIYRNLGRALLVQGDVMGAVAQVRHALEIAQPDDVKRSFVECLRSVPPQAAGAPELEGIEPLLARALAEGWGRPEDLAGFAADLIKRRLAPEDALLRVLLETAPVRDIELERWLTQERRRLLETDDDDSRLGFACALARQCFINEYVFAQDQEELRGVAQLRDAVAAGAPFSAIRLAVLAAYMPLHALPNPEKLLDNKWPQALNAVLDQQIRQPLQERDDRSAVPALTAIEDPVSRAVRDQYEEMPYPRWVKPALIGAPMPVEHHLRGQFRLVPFRALGRTGHVDILVAGCGTGEHPIETARRYANAQVLAIDLSLTSLCYARRMTREIGLTNVEYAQADILKLGTIGRSFDVIESAGVLHHLADPLAGWRVLLSLLRPNGLMFVGLYSKFARQEITLAREFVAQRGYRPTADDIRRCREELIALDNSAPLKSVTKFWDFYSTSTCRDLIFHVQEHQFTIPDIKAFLRANGLIFIGFILDPAIQQHYRMRFPQDPALTDLDCWNVLETENPLIFKGMYQFWVQNA